MVMLDPTATVALAGVHVSFAVDVLVVRMDDDERFHRESVIQRVFLYCQFM